MPRRSPVRRRDVHAADLVTTRRRAPLCRWTQAPYRYAVRTNPRRRGRWRWTHQKNRVSVDDVVSLPASKGAAGDHVHHPGGSRHSRSRRSATGRCKSSRTCRPARRRSGVRRHTAKERRRGHEQEWTVNETPTGGGRYPWVPASRWIEHAWSDQARCPPARIWGRRRPHQSSASAEAVVELGGE